MDTGREKLVEDLEILAAMARQMDSYLQYDVLFWRMSGESSQTPMLTIGGYLMRQHRLLALQDDLLTEVERARLETAVSHYQDALQEKVVRFESKGNEELAARVRQWAAYLNDAEWEEYPEHNYYASSVETRAMLAALIDQLEASPYRLDEEQKRRVRQLDAMLKSQWESGEFVWPDSWRAAYPQQRYWWLYGRPVA